MKRKDREEVILKEALKLAQTGAYKDALAIEHKLRRLYPGVRRALSLQERLELNEICTQAMAARTDADSRS